MDDVILEYLPNWTEFRRAQLGISRGKIALLVVVVSIVALLLGAAEVSEHEWIVLAVVELFWVGAVATILWFGPQHVWKSGRGSQEARRLTISDEGIVRSSASLETVLKWEWFVGIRESDEFFVLRPKWRQNSFSIPKRSLRSQQEEAALRELMERHLPIASNDRRFYSWLFLFVAVVLFATLAYVAVRIA